MSAALVDEFSFGVPTVPTQRSSVRYVPARRPTAATRRPAPCEHGVPIVPSTGQGWRLTARGTAVVLTLFVGLFLAGLVVLVGSFLAVSDAPVRATTGVAPGVVSVIGG